MHLNKTTIARGIRLGFTIKHANHIASCRICMERMQKWKSSSSRR